MPFRCLGREMSGMIALFAMMLVGWGQLAQAFLLHGGAGYGAPPPPSPPVITSLTMATDTVSPLFSYNITAKNSPTSYGASGLPGWAPVNTSSGAMTRTPDTAATPATVIATNTGGTGPEPLPITISSTAPSYTGPCDIATCGEAWSVDYALTRNYVGPLFQLYRRSDGATLDVGCVGATVSGTCAGSTTFKADTTTWSAFCGGDPNNCYYNKLYAQIDGHSNDLIPHGAWQPWE